jgi:hypothetical protein
LPLFHRKNLWRAGPVVVALLMIGGIATGLGTTSAVGCEAKGVPWVLGWGAPPGVPRWSPSLNMFLSLSLLAFACTAAVTNRRLAGALMLAELAGFVVFLFVCRGGYAVGIAGEPLRQVGRFDMASVAIRVMVIGLLAARTGLNWRRLAKLTLLGLGVAVLVVGTKLALFRDSVVQWTLAR